MWSIKMTLFIGDVHGKFEAYNRIIRSSRDTIQVGDMGVGFINPANGLPTNNPPYDKMVEGGHRFIRGNHDNPSACRRHTQWIPDGLVEGDRMFVGGGLSIDRAYRVPGMTWWENEELNQPELDIMLDVYTMVLPRMMVTHDCPESVVNTILATHNMRKFNDPSRTRQALQAMLELHRPEVWIFGHWHHSLDTVIDGTRFVCLAELETKEIA